MEEIDSTIEHQLKAASSVPPDSVRHPDILCNLGTSYQVQFEGFGNIQDLESAIKHWREAVASITLTGQSFWFSRTHSV